MKDGGGGGGGRKVLTEVPMTGSSFELVLLLLKDWSDYKYIETGAKQKTPSEHVGHEHLDM